MTVAEKPVAATKPVRFNADLIKRIEQFKEKEGRNSFGDAVKRLCDLALKSQSL